MEVWKDTIVEEIHAVREQIARECDYDLTRIIERLRANQKEHPERVVSREEVRARRNAERADDGQTADAVGRKEPLVRP